MAVAERKAIATWEGNLVEGKGRFSVGSGAITDQPVTWASRTERSDGKTSPEELIAAAHASCFSMDLSSGLTNQGSPPERLNVTAVCTLDRIEGKLKLVSMAIDVRGTVPGLDRSSFEAAAQDAGKNCPVSGALANNVQTNVTARLEE